jgi:hypothetical protein
MKPGKNFWRKLLHLELAEPEEFRCPFSPARDIGYRGPAKNINEPKNYSPNDPIGGDWVDLDENRTAHGDPEKRGVNVLLKKGGDPVKIFPSNQRDWKNYLEKTVEE